MSKKILVIEDESDLADLLKMRLEKDGYSIIASYDGKDGLDKATTAALRKDPA